MQYNIPAHTQADFHQMGLAAALRDIPEIDQVHRNILSKIVHSNEISTEHDKRADHNPFARLRNERDQTAQEIIHEVLKKYPDPLHNKQGRRMIFHQFIDDTIDKLEQDGDIPQEEIVLALQDLAPDYIRVLNTNLKEVTTDHLDHPEHFLPDVKAYRRIRRRRRDNSPGKERGRARRRSPDSPDDDILPEYYEFMHERDMFQPLPGIDRNLGRKFMQELDGPQLIEIPDYLRMANNAGLGMQPDAGPVFDLSNGLASRRKKMQLEERPPLEEYLPLAEPAALTQEERLRMQLLHMRRAP